MLNVSWEEKKNNRNESNDGQSKRHSTFLTKSPILRNGKACHDQMMVNNID